MTEYRVTVDNRNKWTALFVMGLDFSCLHPIAETYYPQTLRARFWRWVLGE